MEITRRLSDNRIMQFGMGLGDLDACENVEIDDSALDTLQQPGIKTLLPDGSISIAPDLEAQAAEQARQQAIADAAEQHRKDAENVMALFPNATPEQVQSFLRLANVTL